MGQNALINSEETARLELYAEVQKGLQAIDEGRTKTAQEVRKQMEERRKNYQDE